MNSKESTWPFAITQLVGVVVMGCAMVHFVQQAAMHRTNAKDLCAWHARRMNGDDPTSEAATQLWREIISGKRVCPFCGQKHDGNWVSRNAWESQVNAMELRLNGE